MTFKHTKFDESAVMRSLERLAKEKNPVAPEIQKTAAAPVNLTPTPSLVENIIHLCAGLRQSGFNKYADEIETNFMQYKQAQTLYETSTEKGDDLVDRAHPKGSHKLEDVDSEEAVFETILDHQLKSIKMVEKTPTGKLSNASDVIRAVKITLAQDSNYETISKQLENKISQLFPLLDKLIQATSGKIHPPIESSFYFYQIKELSVNPSIENLQQILQNIFKLKESSSISGSDQETKNKIEIIFSSLTNVIMSAIHLKGQLLYLDKEKYKQQVLNDNKTETPIQSSNSLTTLKEKSQVAYNKIDTLLKLISISTDEKRKGRASQWLAARKSKLDKIIAAVRDAGWDTPHGEEVAKEMIPQLDPIFDEITKASFKP